MIIDKLLKLNADQVFEGTGNVDTTDLIDFGVANADVGRPDTQNFMEFDIGTGNSAGGTSAIFQVVDCATVGGTYVARSQSAVYLLAAILNGTRIRVPLPEGLARYVKGRVVMTGTFTAGATFNAAIVD